MQFKFSESNFRDESFETDDGTTLYNSSLILPSGLAREKLDACRSDDEVFGKELGRTRTHFSVGAVVTGHGDAKGRIGYRSRIHARIAVTVVTIRVLNPDWFEQRFLQDKDDMLFYRPSPMRLRQRNTRSALRSLRQEHAILSLCRRGDRCVWCDLEAMQEMSRLSEDSRLFINGRWVHMGDCNYDKEANDYVPIPSDIREELSRRWSGDKNDVLTYHYQASINIRKTFDRTVKCRKVYQEGDPLFPIGWIEVTVRRAKGKTEGQTDNYYISPGGHCFRSKIEVKKFLDCLSAVKGSERGAVLLIEDEAIAASNAESVKSEEFVEAEL